MLGPAAQHLKNNEAASFLRVLDRGADDSPIKQQRRVAWREHGAELVNSLAQLVGDNEFSGVVICAGKNGDDWDILRELVPLLTENQFILHCSTVSCSFVTAASELCAQHEIQYANYPLTGGAKGAESGQMLILASGDKALYEQLTPLLTAIGKPQYFGEELILAAAVKLVGHVLLFHGLLGISLGAVLHKNVLGLTHLAPQQVDFFDLLNQGAGGTRQWEVALRIGLAEDQWQQGFLVRHAVIDALYAASLLQERNLPTLVILPILEIVLLFAYILNKKEFPNPTTQTIARLLAEEPAEKLDAFLQAHLSFDIEQCLQNCIQVLPADLQKSLLLHIP